MLKAANSVVSDLIWLKFKFVQDFMHIFVTCKYKKDRIKKKPRKGGDIIFPNGVNGGFLLPWKPEFSSNLPQNLMQPFPHPIDATHKIWSRLANWLQRYSSLKVWTTMDDDGPLVYYKLTLRAFGSGELKISWESSIFYKNIQRQRSYEQSNLPTLPFLPDKL